MPAEDACLAITGVCFVKRDDCDAILVATEHSAGGKVELWELKEVVHTTHKMFSASSAAAPEAGLAGGVAAGAAPSASAMAAAEQLPKIATPIWKSDETFSGPPSRVVSLATPAITLQTGENAPCFVTVVSWSQLKILSNHMYVMSPILHLPRPSLTDRSNACSGTPCNTSAASICPNPDSFLTMKPTPH